MEVQILIKPILKWAGGKSQLLEELFSYIPKNYNRYIEPFFGGGALFFALNPEEAIISDSNPELINVYRQIAENVEEVITYLKKYQNTEETFYQIRSQNWEDLPSAEAAARTIYLNRTCFNGLYRVNKKGKFNTPFGHYKNPTICDEEKLREASKVLSKATIICGDYLNVLEKYAQKGDLIFLDPPYLPISKYGDFKRYTKEQFHEEDHVRLYEMIKKLEQKGCYIILTSSHHPLIHNLYSDYRMNIVQTRRQISSNSTTRTGEDVIILINPENKTDQLKDQNKKFPTSRFMGSKRKLLDHIWKAVSDLKFDSVLDLFSGSGIVSYLFKSEGKKVISNDYMKFASLFTKALIENNEIILTLEEAQKLLISNEDNDHFVEETFRGLYFTDQENQLIDTIRQNIKKLDNEYKKAIALYALIRACTKKRPRGIFTYTGLDKYNDGRNDLKKSLEDQFLDAVIVINKAVFNNHKENASFNFDAMNFDYKDSIDLVYLDPPYYSLKSDNDYIRRYHFLEGLAKDWKGITIQEHTKTKKFKTYPTPFSKKDEVYVAFNKLFEKYKDSIILISYSSNSLPSREDMISLLCQYKKHVEIIPINYTYSFGNQSKAKTHYNKVQEYLFLGY